MAQEVWKTVDFIQVAQRSLSLLASRPLIFLLIAAPVLLTQLARFASGPTFIITIFIPVIVEAALFHAIYVRANGGEPDFAASYKACASANRRPTRVLGSLLWGRPSPGDNDRRHPLGDSHGRPMVARRAGLSSSTQKSATDAITPQPPARKGLVVANHRHGATRLRGHRLGWQRSHLRLATRGLRQHRVRGVVSCHCAVLGHILDARLSTAGRTRRKRARPFITRLQRAISPSLRLPCEILAVHISWRCVARRPDSTRANQRRRDTNYWCLRRRTRRCQSRPQGRRASRPCHRHQHRSQLRTP